MKQYKTKAKYTRTHIKALYTVQKLVTITPKNIH